MCVSEKKRQQIRVKGDHLFFMCWPCIKFFLHFNPKVNPGHGNSPFIAHTPPTIATLYEHQATNPIQFCLCYTPALTYHDKLQHKGPRFGNCLLFKLFRI